MTIDGERSGKVGNATYWWNDWTQNSAPDWLQVDFNGSQTIAEIDVFTGQDDYLNAVAPTETMTCSLLGLTGYEVQYWNGSSWVTVPGGSVTSNNLVWRKFSFTAITTSKIRVLTSASPDGWSRITEVEAWTGSSGSTAKINWLVTDHLGTPRISVDRTGSVAGVSRHDYLPFGEDLTVARSATPGYSTPDSVRQKFTLYERDTETGLDYGQARYFASTQGRFTGVDRLIASARPLQPQSWNSYSYCVNNPLIFVDPSGMIWGELNSNARWFESKSDMEKAGYVEMTVFLRGNPNGGYYSFDRFQNYYEEVSTLAAFSGVVTEETGFRQLGYTSRELPFFLLADGLPNAGTSVYKSETFQEMKNSQEAHFLEVYLPIASIEWNAIDAFSSASETTAIPEMIFRNGRPNPGNLKPGADGFLSFRDSVSNPYPLGPGEQPVFRFGNDYFGISTSKLPKGSVIPDNIPPGHVSVTGVTPTQLKDAVTVRDKLPN